ncbi:MAG: lipid-A-disaccharide synthase N-terminal domain-containing protein [Candidatus Hydrogenedentota bacterium]
MTFGAWVGITAEAMGVAAAFVFYGRFYMQWIASELKGRSVMPVAFWYMSCAGSFMLLCYAFYSGSPVGALSHCFNMVVYSRNLVHIWRGHGTLTHTRFVVVHGVVAAIVLFALGGTAITWLNEYELTQAAGANAMRRTWFWVAVGVVAQVLFASRFFIQWVITEIRKESVVPVVFWYLSVVAAVLMCASHLNQQEWIFGVGVAATVFVYLRNIWLIHRHGPADTPAVSSPSAGKSLE